MKNMQLVFIDDEEDLRAPISAILRSQGFHVWEFSTPSQMNQWLASNKADVILLDVNLPEENGFQIAKRLKEQQPCNIIMMTAYNSVEDRVEGLTKGADYYLPKPVDVRELIAVIKSLQQRPQPEDIAPDGWLLNTVSWSLTSPDGITHNLNKSELLILSALARNPGQPVSRARLYAEIGIPDYNVESRSLDIQISRIRRRFTTETYTIPLKTPHSVGYLFNDPIRLLEPDEANG